MQKAKKYDWKDSNMALFGSDTEKQVKKESAETEPAWKGAGEKVGLQIWRIEKFQVKAQPKDDYGKFYNGDSYIVLNTYKPDPDSERLAWDVHFWIGSKSTQDEYGTAAYKTVELDTLLNDAAVQHREVRGHESDAFLAYFDSLEIMEGGVASGFRHVKPEEYKPRLMHFNGKRMNVQSKEVALSRSSLRDDDVFILDLGLTVYQWNGQGASKDEKFKAAQYLQKLKSERGGKPSVEVLEQADQPDNHEFYDKLTEELDDDEDDVDKPEEHQLFKVSDAGGALTFEQVKSGNVTPDDLGKDDVFIIDTGDKCIVWVPNGASTAEKKNGLPYAHNHLMKSSHPLVPITVVKEGQKNLEQLLGLAA